MNNFQIIPAIDLIDGKCVRLTKGDYRDKRVYPLSPLDQARQFEENGYKQLHIIDLDGAKLGKSSNETVIREIIENTNLKIQVGGGFRTPEKINSFINCGADQIIISSILFHENFDWSKINIDNITASIDFKEGKIVTNGWLINIETSIDKATNILNNLGISRVIITDVARDGTLSGPNIELASKFKTRFKKTVLIAGGIRDRKV